MEKLPSYAVSEDDHVVEDYTVYEDEMVESVTIRTTDTDTYPCGWKYRLHFGSMNADKPVVRYDNSHEIEKGHERHTADGVEIIDFPGMMDLYDRFEREVDAWWNTHND